MDETFQQACVLMSATVEGQFLTGLVLPPGSTLPTTDQGVIMMDGIWYFNRADRARKKSGQCWLTALRFNN